MCVFQFSLLSWVTSKYLTRSVHSIVCPKIVSRPWGLCLLLEKRIASQLTWHPFPGAYIATKTIGALTWEGHVLQNKRGPLGPTLPGCLQPDLRPLTSLFLNWTKTVYKCIYRNLDPLQYTPYTYSINISILFNCDNFKRSLQLVLNV